MNEYGLQLATQKTEIVVLTKKRIETLFPMTVLCEEIMTKEAVKCLRITLDTKFTFSSHTKAASAKAARVTTELSGLMSNMSGARQSKRRLLMLTVHLILLYGAEVLANALKFEFYRLGIAAVKRTHALRIACFYRTCFTTGRFGNCRCYIYRSAHHRTSV